MSHDHGSVDTSSEVAHHSMFFVLSSEVTVWFESWTVKSVGGLVGICVGLFFVAALYEALKWFREYLLYKAVKGVKQRAVAKSHTRDASLANGGVAMRQFDPCQNQVEVHQTQHSVLLRLPIIDHMIQSLMHMLQILFSYLLMLAFMTYNVWIGIAVVLGGGVGYFVVAARIPKISSVIKLSEHCH